MAQGFGRRWLKRLVRSLAWMTLGVVLSWLVSCGGGSGAANDNTLEFWTMQLQPKFTTYFEELIEEFEGSHPGITVKWLDVPWSAMESKILTSVSAGTAPDVVNLNPTFASKLAERDAWLPLGDRLDAPTQESYLDNIWQAAKLEGQSFSLPWYLTTRLTIFNKELLAAAGIEQPPTTYEELAAVATQVREKTGKYAFFATFVPDDSGEVLESFVQMGTTLVDEQGQAAFNSPEGKKAFQFWVDLYKNGLLPKESLTQGHRRAIDLYQAGQTAILASSPEFMGAIATNAPTVAAVSEAAPQVSGDTEKVSAAMMTLVVPKQTKKPDLATEFAAFVTNSANQLAFAQAANVLPSQKDALGTLRDELVLAAEKAKGEENTDSKLVQARLLSAVQLERADVLLPPIRNIKLLQSVIYENLQAAMLDEKTVDEAIADAAEAWNQG
ncbi:MAG: sugar ABC transporter substrate-binding protein [Cyanobacteria bacterium P01_C01_bin.89]